MTTKSAPSPDKKLPAAQWLPFFIRANILAKALTETQSMQSKTIKIGQFLSPNVNRPVPIQVNGRHGIATLRFQNGRAKTKLYFFEVNWTGEPETPAPHSPRSNAGEEGSNRPVMSLPENSEDAKVQPPPTAALKAEAVPKIEGEKKVGGGNDEVWD